MIGTTALLAAGLRESSFYIYDEWRSYFNEHVIYHQILTNCLRACVFYYRHFMRERGEREEY